MPTDWRSLFNEIGVHWVDHGPNVMYGRPTIKCPLCFDDPSEHMNFSDIGYYCLRNRQHSGTVFPYILRRLLPTYNREAIFALLNRHATTVVTTRQRQAPTPPSEVEQQWSRFLPAAEHPHYLDYLQRRGFPEPDVLCRRYDLRYSRMGKWSARLLIPITDAQGTMVSWTGRAIIDVEPRYLTAPMHHEGLVYVPGPMRATAVLVEGPMDALKIVEACRHIAPIALLGLAANPTRILRLVDLIRNCREVLVCLDPEVPYQVFQTLSLGLARRMRSVIVKRFPPPSGWEDVGATPIADLATHFADLNRTRGNVNVLTVEEFHSLR